MIEEIRNGITNGDNFSKLRLEIVKFEKNGKTQNEALEIVESLLSEFQNDEDANDLLLDLLDCITGWCHPKYRIWN